MPALSDTIDLADSLRAIGPPLLALAATLAIDLLTRRRNLLPPGFEPPPAAALETQVARFARRSLALLAIWGVLWIGVFYPLAFIGLEQEIVPSEVAAPQLFLLHGLFVAALATWHLLGFAGVRSDEGRDWRVQYGFRTRSILGELGIGVVTGLGAWLLVLGALLGIGLLIWSLGGEESLPSEPPSIILWISSLPVWMRLAVSLSAGIFEETFFRGFLQPRVGIAFSSALFVLAHASYDQPLMLVGVTLLSLIYGLLVRWRQSVWAAISAHALFDAVQLLVVIPAALELLPEGGGKMLAVLTALT